MNPEPEPKYRRNASLPETEPKDSDFLPKGEKTIAEPLPEWSKAIKEWGVAWEFHQYGLGVVYALLFFLISMWLWKRVRRVLTGNQGNKVPTNAQAAFSTVVQHKKHSNSHSTVFYFCASRRAHFVIRTCVQRPRFYLSAFVHLVRRFSNSILRNNICFALEKALHLQKSMGNGHDTGPRKTHSSNLTNVYCSRVWRSQHLCHAILRHD